MEKKYNSHATALIRSAILFMFALVAILSFGCVKKAEKEIRIGAILPLTGDAALYGENAKNAIELA